MAIKILGLDPSMRNWGIALMQYDKGRLSVIETNVLQFKPNEKINKNIQDLHTAHQLYEALEPYFKQADVIIAELPHGSQSSRAMVSYAMCISLIGALTHINPNLISVSASQVKKVVSNQNKVPKDLIIHWVREHYPLLGLPVKTKAEHICDSIVAVHAGIKTKAFKQITENLNANHHER